MGTDRRYDIDWLRVIAIFMLMVYHASLVYQPWGKVIGFIQSGELSSDLFIPMSIFHIWRIPLLFMVSGMGVAFALRRRDWKQLLLDRAKRILLPLMVCSFTIVPLHIFLFQDYYNLPVEYTPTMGHLWFLGHILAYIAQISGLFFLEKNYDYLFFRWMRRLLKQPYMIYLLTIPFMIEAIVVNPQYFSLFVGTGHGFLYNMLMFTGGFLFVSAGEVFWNAVSKTWKLSLIMAIALFFNRWLIQEWVLLNFVIAFESVVWIFAILGFGYNYFNKNSSLLSYLSTSVYPVYILHMIFLYLGCYYILPMNYSWSISFPLIVIVTIFGSYTGYEVVKRLKYIRIVFGMKN